MCSKKWLRIHGAIRDLTCGALEIPLVLILLGVTEPEKTRSVCLLDFFFVGVPNHPCFSINDLQFATLTYLNNEPVFKIYFCNEVRLLRFTNIPYICEFIIFCVFIFNLHLVFFISNYGQGSALKVANIFKVFVSQSCLIVSKWFE